VVKFLLAARADVTLAEVSFSDKAIDPAVVRFGGETEERQADCIASLNG
jgi:hypothetical protein